MDFKKATLQQTYDVIRVLKDVVEKRGDRCKYKEDWSDKKVAEVTATKVTAVSRIRREMFGSLAKYPKKEKKLSARDQKILKLEANVAELEKRTAELARTYAALADRVSLNGDKTRMSSINDLDINWVPF